MGLIHPKSIFWRLAFHLTLSQLTAAISVQCF